MAIEDQVRETLKRKADDLPDAEALIAESAFQMAGGQKRLAPLVAILVGFVTTITIGAGLFLTLTDPQEAGPGERFVNPRSEAGGPVAEPVAFLLGDGLPGWRLAGATDEPDGNRRVVYIDDAAGPAGEEGILPTLSLSTGPTAQGTWDEITSGLVEPEWTFEIQGLDAYRLASGVDENGLDSGLIVWNSPDGVTVTIDYDRLGHSEAADIVESIRPVGSAEWNRVLEESRSTRDEYVVIEDAS